MISSLLILCVHYKNSEEVKLFCDHVLSLTQKLNIHTFISISDNSGELSDSFSINSQITVSRPDKNLGYLDGCHFAYQNWIKDNTTKPDLICITNTDISFDQDYFKQLQELSLPDDAGAFSPQILLTNGNSQNPYLTKKLPRWRVVFTKYTLHFSLLNMVMKSLVNLKRSLKQLKQTQSTQRIRKIFAGHGAHLYILPQFFEKGGSLLSDFFLYHEEICLAEKIKEQKLVWYFGPELHVLHKSGSTTDSFTSKERRNLKIAGIEYILTKYY